MNRFAPRGGSVITCFLLLLCLASDANSQPGPDSFDVGARFYASGWIGDGMYGEKHLKLIKGWRENPHSAPLCMKITYSPGPETFAGIFWQNKPNNWGEKSGRNFSKSGFTKLVFMAKGEKGGELVEFKIGGIDNTGENPR